MRFDAIAYRESHEVDPRQPLPGRLAPVPAGGVPSPLLHALVEQDPHPTLDVIDRQSHGSARRECVRDLARGSERIRTDPLEGESGYVIDGRDERLLLRSPGLRAPARCKLGPGRSGSNRTNNTCP